MATTSKQNLASYVLRTHALVLAMISRVDGGIRWEKFNCIALLTLPHIIIKDKAVVHYTENMTWAFDLASQYDVYFSQFGCKKMEWLDECLNDSTRYREWVARMQKRRGAELSQPAEEEGETIHPATTTTDDANGTLTGDDLAAAAVLTDDETDS